MIIGAVLGIMEVVGLGVGLRVGEYEGFGLADGDAVSLVGAFEQNINKND